VVTNQQPIGNSNTKQRDENEKEKPSKIKKHMNDDVTEYMECACSDMYRPIGVVSAIAGVAVFRQTVRSTSTAMSMPTGDNMAAGYDVTRT